jgi:hypothetical protein
MVVILDPEARAKSGHKKMPFDVANGPNRHLGTLLTFCSARYNAPFDKQHLLFFLPLISPSLAFPQ